MNAERDYEWRKRLRRTIEDFLAIGSPASSAAVFSSAVTQ
jgi:hypothetical protein